MVVSGCRKHTCETCNAKVQLNGIVDIYLEGTHEIAPQHIMVAGR
jgi:hypothetical protein